MLCLRKLIKFKHISTKYIRPFSSSFYNGLSGSNIITKILGEQKVKTVFGHPGGAILPTYDKINKTNQFRFVFTIHRKITHRRPCVWMSLHPPRCGRSRDTKRGGAGLPRHLSTRQAAS